MANDADQSRMTLDTRIDSPGREGLTGTTPADAFRPVQESDQITIAPDWRPMDEQPAWRNDFPIDWPQDHYVERREFMKFIVLTSAALTAGQFWIVAQNWFRRRAAAPEGRRIASTADLPVGGSLVFAYPNEHDTSVLVRVSESDFVAFSQKCTHLSCAVIPKPAEGVFHCPCHEGLFDLRTGSVIAGPPRRPLPRILLEVRDGGIYAVGVEERTV